MEQTKSKYQKIVDIIALVIASGLCIFQLYSASFGTWSSFVLSAVHWGVIGSYIILPGVVTLIPRYSIMQSLKWIDTYQALIVPSIFTAFGIFLMRQSCAVIPNELIEAARMDGANEFYIFHRIIIPQLNNAIVSMSVFQFLWAWDDYLWPFLMIRDTKKQLLPVALNLFSGQYSTDYAGLFAATSIAIIPVVIFYIIFQKKFIAGISSSAIKG